MMRKMSKGLTLIEILVTLVVSGVVIIGLGSIYTQAAGDYNRLARMREERYSQQLLESELLWRLKVVPPEYLPTAGQLTASTVTFTDDSGSKTRRVLCYDYPRNDTRTTMGTAVGTNLVPPVPAGVQVRTGMIFQWFSVVYVVERDITGNPAGSFRNLGAGVQGFISGLFTAPPPPGTVFGPLPIAIGVDNLTFEIPSPGRVTWNYSQYL